MSKLSGTRGKQLESVKYIAESLVCAIKEGRDLKTLAKCLKVSLEKLNKFTIVDAKPVLINADFPILEQRMLAHYLEVNDESNIQTVPVDLINRSYRVWHSYQPRSYT